MAVGCVLNLGEIFYCFRVSIPTLWFESIPFSSRGGHLTPSAMVLGGRGLWRWAWYLKSAWHGCRPAPGKGCQPLLSPNRFFLLLWKAAAMLSSPCISSIQKWTNQQRFLQSAPSQVFFHHSKAAEIRCSYSLLLEFKHISFLLICVTG